MYSWSVVFITHKIVATTYALNVKQMQHGKNLMEKKESSKMLLIFWLIFD